MSISTTNITLLGTSAPWAFHGDGTSHAGAANTDVPFASGYYDGSTAGGAAVGVNTAYTYGGQHTNPAETTPQTLAVTENQAVIIQYNSGTVTSFSGDSGHGPTGTLGTPTGPNYTDPNGWNYPTNFIKGATTARMGLVGCFTDATGQIVPGSFFDWKSRGGTDSANSRIVVTTPVAGYLTIGIDDTVLNDNGGSFSLTVYSLDVTNFVGSKMPFVKFPIQMGITSFLPDWYPALAQLVLVQCSSIAFDTRINGFMRGVVGQGFPHSANGVGQQGQGFPY